MIKRNKRNIGKKVRLIKENVRPHYQGWQGKVVGFRGNAYFEDNNRRRPVPQVLVQVWSKGRQGEMKPGGVFTFQGNNLEVIQDWVAR